MGKCWCNHYSSGLSSDNIRSIKPISGGNRLIWDMRYPGFVSFDGMILYSSPNTGPKVTPGKYDVKLTYNDIEIIKEFEIIKDPRVSNTPEDYTNQLDFLLSVRDEVSKANQTIINIRKIKNDLSYLLSKSENNNDQKMIDKTIDIRDELFDLSFKNNVTVYESVDEAINDLTFKS